MLSLPGKRILLLIVLNLFLCCNKCSSNIPTSHLLIRQQRHRSTLTSALPKEVMFRPNPRKPASLSFEKIQFAISDERLSRLRDSWLNPKQMELPQQHNAQPDSATLEKWNDEFIITHLSSDTIIGLRHEIDVLIGLEILIVKVNGKLELTQGWEKRVPHMVLNEMRDTWGKMHDLFCINNMIKSSLESCWEEDEFGWQLASSLDDKLVFEEEEYQLRKQIFTENYNNWVNEQSGVGEFGV